MKIDRATFLQIVIGILSCPIIPAIISGTWALGIKISLIVFAYILLLSIYIFYSWDYKAWNISTVEVEKRHYASNIVKFLNRTHFFYIRAFILMQLLGSLIIVTQSHLPEYAAGKVSETMYNDSLAQNSFSRSAIPFSVDTTSTGDLKATSYVAALNSRGIGSAYPLGLFLSYKLPIFFRPIWDMIGSCWLLFFVFFIFMLIIEIVANIFLFSRTE